MDSTCEKSMVQTEVEHFSWHTLDGLVPTVHRLNTTAKLYIDTNSDYTSCTEIALTFTKT